MSGVGGSRELVRTGWAQLVGLQEDAGWPCHIPAKQAPVSLLGPQEEVLQ